MLANIFIRFAIILIINQSQMTHGLLRVPVRLQITSPFDNYQQIHIQPQQQLIVFPQFHRIPLPQSLPQPLQNFFAPQINYDSTSRIISPQQVGYFDPIVSYIHQQLPYQTSSYMNFNLAKRLLKPVGEKEINLMNDEKFIDSVVMKSGDEHDCNDNRDEESKKEMLDKMEITTSNLMETTTEIFEVMKSEMGNQEDSTTNSGVEINTEKIV